MNNQIRGAFEGSPGNTRHPRYPNLRVGPLDPAAFDPVVVERLVCGRPVPAAKTVDYWEAVRILATRTATRDPMSDQAIARHLGKGLRTVQRIRARLVAGGRLGT